MITTNHRRARCFAASCCLSLFLVPLGAPAAALTWDTVIAANATIDAGSGTWQNGAGNWNNGTTSVGINWNNTTPDTATFAGADGGPYAVSLGGAITAGSLSFANSGYTLSAASAQTLTLGGNISVSSGKSATIGANVTAFRSTGYTVNGGGTLNITGAGAKLQSAGNLSVAAGTKVVLGTGGMWTNTGSILIGSDTAANNSLEVNGGDVWITTTSGVNLILANGASGSASITLTNGNIVNNLIGGAVRFGPASATTASGTFHLDGGSLTVGRIFEGNTGYSSTFNFNGGTLKVLATSANLANFMSGIDTANVRNGGATLDINGAVLTFGQSLTHSVIGGDNAVDGGLTVNDTATTKGLLTLTNASTYTGPTAVNAGTVRLTSGSALGSGSGETTVAAGAAVALSGGVSVTENVTLSGAGSAAITGTEIVAPSRGALQSCSGSNLWNGTITIGANATRLGVQDGAVLALNGSINGGANGVIFRSGGAGKVFVNSTGNSWSVLDVFGSSTVLGTNNALPTGGRLRIGTTSIGVSAFDLNGFNQTVASLENNGGAGADAWVTNSGAASSTLTIADTGTNSFPGIIVDGASTISLIKAGSGTQTLSGTNTYTGSTTVSGGALNINGQLGNSTVTVNSTGTLGGTGVISGPVTVSASGTLAPGAGGIGTLTFSNSLTLAGTVVVELNGSTADLINAGANSINLGGSLVVTNIAGATLTDGTTYNLFDGTLAGTFGSIALPGGAGHWNTTQLTAGGNGTLVFSNIAPIVPNITNGLAVGSTLQTAVIGKYCRDANGDPLTIISIGTPANGTAAIIGGTNIQYTSTAAANDSFSYTVSDGFTTNTATFAVQTYTPEGFNKLSGPTGTGPYSFSYLGIPNEDYALEESPNLVPPYTWTPVVTNTAAANGALDFNGVTLTYPSGSFRTRHVP